MDHAVQAPYFFEDTHDPQYSLTNRMMNGVMLGDNDTVVAVFSAEDPIEDRFTIAQLLHATTTSLDDQGNVLYNLLFLIES